MVIRVIDYHLECLASLVWVPEFKRDDFRLSEKWVHYLLITQVLLHYVLHECSLLHLFETLDLVQLGGFRILVLLLSTLVGGEPVHLKTTDTFPYPVVRVIRRELLLVVLVVRVKIRSHLVHQDLFRI